MKKLIILLTTSISLCQVTTFSVTNNDITNVKNYYNNGSIKNIGAKVGNFKIGTWYYYDKNGKMLKAERYKNGKLLKSVNMESK